MAPTTAFHVLQGLETLPIRMEKHVANTREVVAFLDDHEAVASVSYPELPSHPDRELAQRLLPNGVGAVFSFDIKGGREAGRTFIENLSILLPSGQRRGCQVTGHPPGEHHPSPHGCRSSWPPPGSAKAWYGCLSVSRIRVI